MNKLIPHSNERNLNDRMIKKVRKKIKITIYINKMYLFFRQLNHRNFIIKHVLLETMLENLSNSNLRHGSLHL